MTTTAIRALILAILALVGLVFPDLIPEGTREVIADHAVAIVAGVLGTWAVFAGERAINNAAPKQGEEE